MKILSEGELRDYLNEERKDISRRCGRLDDDAIREYVTNGWGNEFREKYYREHGFCRCSC